VQEGRLWRIHRGWYAEPGTDAQLIRAMRLGGRLGCVSAARVYGAWAPPDSGLHLLMPRSASGRRLGRAENTGDSIRVHWHAPRGEQSWKDGIAPLDIALSQVVRCQDLATAVAVLDSLLHRRPISERALAVIRAGMPSTSHPVFDAVDPRSEEGIESLTRVRLAEAGVTAVPQHVVDGVGRVDLLIDGWLVIELDGRGTHAQKDAFARDRRRTALLQQRGYAVLHFAYAHVVHDWSLVLETVLSVLAQR